MSNEVAKLKTYTDMQRKFLLALETSAKGNIREAMRQAGYSDNTASVDIIKTLKPEIIEIAETLLAANAVKAVIGLTDVLDKPGQLGASAAVAAAKEILDRAGMVKKEEGSTAIHARSVVFILPAKAGQKIVEGDYSVVEQLESDSTPPILTEDES